MPEYKPISVHKDTKRQFNSLRRRLEAKRDEDLTENDVALWLIDQAPNPIQMDEQPADQ